MNEFPRVPEAHRLPVIEGQLAKSAGKVPGYMPGPNVNVPVIVGVPVRVPSTI